MDKNHGMLEGHEEKTKAKIYLHSLRATLKKYQIVKRQAMMAYMDTSFKKFTSEWMAKGKTTMIQKDNTKKKKKLP